MALVCWVECLIHIAERLVVRELKLLSPEIKYPIMASWYCDKNHLGKQFSALIS